MPIIEIINIGTELLLGDIQDTNSRFIAQHLKETGYDLYRISTVGDNQGRIAALIKEAFQRADILITTGGLGPTVDDPTRDAVAAAFDLPLVFHDALWGQIQSRFAARGVKASENNRKQALLPQGALPIENKYGTAPGFILPRGGKFIICLQGVPHEMEHLLIEDAIPFLQKNLPPTHVLAAKVLHTIGIGESTLDEKIGKLEELRNPTVGLLAKSGRVDIRIVASATFPEEATRMVGQIETQIQASVQDHIFGVDDEKIEVVISTLARSLKTPLKVCLAGFPAEFAIDLPSVERKDVPCQQGQPSRIGFEYQKNSKNTPNQITIFLPGQSKIIRTFNGPQQSFDDWARNMIYYHVWQELKNLSTNGKTDEKS